jgi:hypothetical protein
MEADTFSKSMSRTCGVIERAQHRIRLFFVRLVLRLWQVMPRKWRLWAFSHDWN